MASIQTRTFGLSDLLGHCQLPQNGPTARQWLCCKKSPLLVLETDMTSLFEMPSSRPSPFR